MHLSPVALLLVGFMCVCLKGGPGVRTCWFIKKLELAKNAKGSEEVYFFVQYRRTLVVRRMLGNAPYTRPEF